MCCLALSEKNLRMGTGRRVGCGALWACNCGCSVRQYAFVKVQRWSAAALVLRRWVQLIRWCRLLQGGRSRLGAELGISDWVRAGETATIQLFDWPAAFRFQTGLRLEAFLAADGGVDRQGICRSVTREITRERVRLGKKLWGQHGRRVAGEGRRRGRGGRAQAGLEAFLRRLKGLHRYERYTRVYESLRKNFLENKYQFVDGWGSGG